MIDNEPEEYHDWSKPSRSPRGLSFAWWYVVVLGILGATFAFKSQLGGYLAKLYQFMGG